MGKSPPESKEPHGEVRGVKEMALVNVILMLYTHGMLEAFPKKYIFEIVTVIIVMWGSLFTNTMDTQ